MRRTIAALIVALAWVSAVDLYAQRGDGSLRGMVVDEQGGAMPGVTVTATSPVLFTPSVAVPTTRATTGSPISRPALTRSPPSCPASRSSSARAFCCARAATSRSTSCMELGTLEEIDHRLRRLADARSVPARATS